MGEAKRDYGTKTNGARCLPNPPLWEPLTDILAARAGIMDFPGGGNTFIIVDKYALVNSRFAKLDKARGSLRLLHILGNRIPPMSRSIFLKFAERSGVGKSAFYSSIRALRELGLIEEKRVRNRSVSLKVTELTPRGVSVAKKVSELFSDLSNG